jgi:hypothetical protein
MDKKNTMVLGRLSGNATITAEPNKDGTVRLSYTRTVSIEEARNFWGRQRDLELTTPSAE